MFGDSLWVQGFKIASGWQDPTPAEFTLLPVAATD